jgi:hypothetical protein
MEPPVPVPPIVIAEGMDVDFFRTTEGVGRYIEPWAVTDPCFVAYDGEGRRLDLVIERHVKHRKWLPDLKFEVVGVHLQEGEPSHVDELRALLSRFCAEVGIPTSANDSLDRLFHAIIERRGFQEESVATR